MNLIKKPTPAEKPTTAEVTAKILSRKLMDAMANSPIVILGLNGKEIPVMEVRVEAKKVVLVTGQ